MSRCSAMLQRHGWTLFAHPLFLSQLHRLTTAAARARRADPAGWRSNANVRLLAALRERVLDRVPRDPLAAEFRQGNTLGTAHRHRFRAKFGANRFRLFFRADSASRIIVYAWVTTTTRSEKPGRDRSLHSILSNAGPRHPAGDWTVLLAEAKEATGGLTAIVTDPNC